MSDFDNAKRDAADLAKLVNEDVDVTTRYGENPKISAPKAIRQITEKGNDAIRSYNITPAFDFASGFTIETRNQAGNDANGDYWIYNGTLPFTVAAGTVPSEPNYTNIIFSAITDSSIWGDRYVGTFASGFTYTSDTDVARGQDGKYYRYIGNASYPVVVVAGTVASDFSGLYGVAENTNHNLLTDRSAVGAHDDIYYRKTNVAEVNSGVFKAGSLLKLSDRENAIFEVLVGGTPNGFDVIDAGGGNTAKIKLESGVIYAGWFGVKKGIDTTVEITALRDFMATDDNADKYTLIFTGGVYIYSQSPNWAIKNLTVKALGSVTFRNTGTGDCIVFDDPVGTTFNISWCWDNPMFIEGDDNTGYGFYHRSIHHSRVALNIRGCGLNVQRSEFAVCNEFKITSSINQGPFYSATRPSGISLSSRNAGEETSANTWYNPIIEGMIGVGIFVDEALNNKFINGTSEGNLGANVECSQNSKNNQFYGTDLEVTASGQGFIDRGKYNNWIDIFNDANSTVTSTAVKSRIKGGILSGITNQGNYTSIIDVVYGANGDELTDTGAFTTIKDAYDIESASVKVRNKTLGVSDAVTRTVSVGAFASPSTVPGRVTKLAIPVLGVKIGDSVAVTAANQEPEEFTSPTARCVVDGQIEISFIQLYGAATSPFPSGSDFIVKFGN